MTDLWTHVGFARLATLIGERAGLRFAPNRQPAAEAAIRRVMRDAGEGDPLRFAHEVERNAELQVAVLAEVTVGETYFFREPGQLDFIRHEVLPTFRATHTAARPLRVWSAGCATGEETYTLAITLREAGFERTARVLGTDLPGPRLAAAEHARYTKWSLRGVAEEDVGRYFIRRGKQFLLRPEIRAMVEFRPLNLATSGYPGGRSGIGEMDLILCRNVLIYFDRETVAAVASRLLASLGEDGWLFLGASDPMLTDIVPCETVVTGAGLAYRRPGADGAAVGEHVGRRRWDRGMGADRAMTRRGTGTSAGTGVSAAGDPFAAFGSVVVDPAASGNDAATDNPARAANGVWTANGALAPGVARGAPPNDKIAPGTLSGTTLPPPAVPAERPQPPVPAPGPADHAPADGTEPAPPPYLEHYDARDYGAAADLAAEAVGRDPRDANAWVTLVRALANSGRVDEAERACTVALGRRPDAAPLAFLHAVLLARHGQHAAAAAAARRAVYLDRTLAVAQITLGSALIRLGERDQARRAFRAAERLLERLPGDAMVPLADGESARRLAEAARAHRRRLETSTA